jgi:hypothetical protein
LRSSGQWPADVAETTYRGCLHHPRHIPLRDAISHHLQAQVEDSNPCVRIYQVLWLGGHRAYRPLIFFPLTHVHRSALDRHRFYTPASARVRRARCRVCHRYMAVVPLRGRIRHGLGLWPILSRTIGHPDRLKIPRWSWFKSWYVPKLSGSSVVHGPSMMSLTGRPKQTRRVATHRTFTQKFPQLARIMWTWRRERAFP